jgi:hypothetical protein
MMMMMVVVMDHIVVSVGLLVMLVDLQLTEAPRDPHHFIALLARETFLQSRYCSFARLGAVHIETHLHLVVRQQDASGCLQFLLPQGCRAKLSESKKSD